MMPELRVWVEYASVTLMLGGILSQLLGDTDDVDDEDCLVAEAHDVVLDALSDADRTAVTEIITDRNWRDQLTIEQAVALHEERELRRMGNRRN